MPVDGYPTEDELTRIREWDVIEGDTLELMAYVKSVGNYWAEDSFGWHERDMAPDELFRDDEVGRRFEVSTGGWSGNEDIIDALRQTKMFWILHWHSSQRGGHYVFEVTRTEGDDE